MQEDKYVNTKFATWKYTRPDYSDVKKKINDCKNRMLNAISYQVFRDVWLDVKKEVEYLIFQADIFSGTRYRWKTYIRENVGNARRI